MTRSCGPPDNTTPGNVGDIYQDINTGRIYRCKDVKVHQNDHGYVTVSDYCPKNEYVWESLSKSVQFRDCSYFCSRFDYYSNRYIPMRLDEITSCDTSKAETFEACFAGIEGMTSAPPLDTSSCVNFMLMFYCCFDLQDIPCMDTSKGANFYGMCEYTDLRETLVIDTSSGTDFSRMYANCDALMTMHPMDVSSGTHFTRMFAECHSLTNVSDLNTVSGTEFSYMFSDCRSLTVPPKLNTDNGTNFSYMFSECAALIETPDIHTCKGTNFSYMFNKCTALKRVTGLDLNNAQSVDNIVMSCPNLTELLLYNIRIAITIGNDSFNTGLLLSTESLVHTIKELCMVQSSTKLTMGSTNIDKISSLYCRVTDDTTEKIDMELCEASDEGAMTLADYAALKNWTFA